MATFPISICEFVHPVNMDVRDNVIAFPSDAETWDQTQKSSSYWRHERVDLTFRVRAANAATFFQFLEDNKAVLVTLNIPGVQPFLRAAESNDCYILKYTKPVRERQFGWRTTISLLRPS